VTKVPIPIVRQVLEAFYSEISEEDTLIFGHATGRDFVLQTLGEERAKTVLGQLSVLEGSRTLEALELVDPRTLANFLVNEHPQTVALILAHLEPGKKCEVLKRLPDGPKVFGAEVGVFTGKMSQCLLDHPGVHLYMVDSWEGDGAAYQGDSGDWHASLSPDRQEQFFRAAAEVAMDHYPRAKVFRGRSTDVVEHVE